MRKHFREKSALVSSLSPSRVPKEVPAAAGQKVVSLENTISEMCLSFASGNIYDAADGDALHITDAAADLDATECCALCPGFC